MSEPADAPPPSGSLLRVAIFSAGVLVGAAMVYLSPPPGGEGGPMGPPPGAEGSDGGPKGPPLDGAPPDKAAGPGASVGGGALPAPGAEGPPPGAEGPPPGAEGPPPGGEGPPPGAEGPPPGAEGPPPGEEQPGGPPLPSGQGAGADWLGKHLEQAAATWTALATEAESQGKAGLAAELRAMATAAPQSGDRPPPLDQVVVFLSNERVLIERARAEGLDTSALERQISPLLR